MIKSNQNINGITGILIRVRAINSEIGRYIEHYVNENFISIVKLSNGRIEIPISMAKDQEVQPPSISVERIEKVTKTFRLL